MNVAIRSKIVKLTLHIIGVVLCVAPPASCILAYFPLWKSEGSLELLSGMTVLLLALAARPIFKLIGEKFRSAATWGAWLLLFVLFFALSRIANEMVVISLTGLIGNLFGAICFRLAERAERKEKA